MIDASAIFAAVGGADAFDALVEAFYAGVESDPSLRAMYPQDLAPGKRALSLFLQQRFGGPQTYSAERGHPRLRMRHMGFAIDQFARDAWLGHMLSAVRRTPAFARHEDVLARYFDDAATFLINR